MTREVWTISELLDELDGLGLIITDQDLIEETLEEFGFNSNSSVLTENQ